MASIDLIPPTPPPAPASPPSPFTGSFHHKAASYAVLAIPLGIALNLASGSVARDFAESSTGRGIGLTIQMLPGLVSLSAFPAGIIALFGIPKYGAKKLLWKGLFGVLIPALLFATAIPAFNKVRRASLERAQQQQPQPRSP